VPAIGVVNENKESGEVATVWAVAKVPVASGQDAGWSGFAGHSLWLGSGGMLVLSGDPVLLVLTVAQKIGVATSGFALVFANVLAINKTAFNVDVR
jgi:hypothetical protein